MARLPMLVAVQDLRFTSDNTLGFTLRWDASAMFAASINHVRVRFMLTNLASVGMGITDADIKTLMEAWDDEDAVEDIATPATWESTLVIHQIGDTYGRAADPGGVFTAAERAAGAAARSFTNGVVRQRFVRCIAQARTAI